MYSLTFRDMTQKLSSDRLMFNLKKHRIIPLYLFISLHLYICLYALSPSFPLFELIESLLWTLWSSQFRVTPRLKLSNNYLMFHLTPPLYWFLCLISFFASPKYTSSYGHSGLVTLEFMDTTRLKLSSNRLMFNYKKHRIIARGSTNMLYRLLYTCLILSSYGHCQ